MVETCRIAIALKKANLPFTLSYKESYLNRILEEGWVRIIPEDMGIKYAYHNFPKEYDVADSIYLNWIFEACSKGNRRKLKQQLKKINFLASGTDNLLKIYLFHSRTAFLSFYKDLTLSCLS
jgi:hypothetical protein